MRKSSASSPSHPQAWAACVAQKNGIEIGPTLILRGLRGVEPNDDVRSIEKFLARHIQSRGFDSDEFSQIFADCDFGDRAIFNIPIDIWLSVFGKLIRQKLGNCVASVASVDHLLTVLVTASDHACYNHTDWCPEFG